MSETLLKKLGFENSGAGGEWIVDGASTIILVALLGEGFLDSILVSCNGQIGLERGRLDHEAFLGGGEAFLGGGGGAFWSVLDLLLKPQCELSS